jgi:hypothetical protein
MNDEIAIPDGTLFDDFVPPEEAQRQWVQLVVRKVTEHYQRKAASAGQTAPIGVTINLQTPEQHAKPCEPSSTTFDYDRIEKIFLAAHRQPLRVDSAELRHLLPICERTLDRWMNDRIIPYEQVPTSKKSDRGKLLFDLAAVDKALKRWRRNAVGD